MQTVLDYFEGWFEGDAARMERALHRDLAKRRSGEELGITTKRHMVELTESGEGKQDAADGRIDPFGARLVGGDVDDALGTGTAGQPQAVLRRALERRLRLGGGPVEQDGDLLERSLRHRTAGIGGN